MTDALTPELQARLQSAAELAEEERWEEAFELLQGDEEAIASEPAVLVTLGVIAGEIPRLRALAYDYFRRALEEEPTTPEVLVTLGVGLARYDDPDAEGVLRLAALTAPELLAARLQYGAYLAREGMAVAALAELEAARAIDPDDARIARETAVAHHFAGDAERAVEALERAAELADDDPEIRALLGLALVRAGRLEEAAEALHRAGADRTDEGDLQLAGALAAATQEWWDEAWDALARAETAAAPAGQVAVEEAEEAIDAGIDAARSLLRDEIAPALLHERMIQRP